MESTIGPTKINNETTIKLGSASMLSYLFLLLVFCVDLFTPILIWKGLLPASVRWISHASIAIIIVWCIFRMIVFDHIPLAFLFIVGVSALWGLVALYQGQGITPTIWGWWLLFQFPFVGLFIYLEPNLSQKLPGALRKLCFILLGIEVAVQLLQYVQGQTPGDDLAGTFGYHASGQTVIFTLLLICLFLGYWITSKRWKELAFSFVLGIISNALAENKLFPAGFAALGILAVVLFSIRYGSIVKMFQYLVFITVTLVGFFYLYNAIIPTAQQTPLQTFLTDPQKLLSYLNYSEGKVDDRGYHTSMEKNYVLSVGWNSLEKDPLTLFFGWGIGARSESRTLNTAGLGLQANSTGLYVGTSLAVFMQEMGVIGLILLCGFLIWIIVSLVHDINKNPLSPANELRYALLLFSALWPIWLWYATSWTMRAPMLLYWMSLGYVLAESRQPIAKTIRRKFPENESGL